MFLDRIPELEPSDRLFEPDLDREHDPEPERECPPTNDPIQIRNHKKKKKKKKKKKTCQMMMIHHLVFLIQTVYEIFSYPFVLYKVAKEFSHTSE